MDERMGRRFDGSGLTVKRLALLDQQQSMSTKPPQVLATALVLTVAGPPSRK